MSESRSVFLAPARTNMWDSADQNPGFVRAAIAKVLAALDGLPDDALEVPHERLDALAEARRELNDLDRFLPEVLAWCVVKHYSNSGGGGDWQPCVWCALKTEAQAEEFRNAIAAHYDKQADAHGWVRDKWTVEFRPARIGSVVAPDVTAAEYVSGVLR